MAAGVPNRKMKPMLTLIPEEERAINYRFTVVLVGEKALEYAQLAVNSDMAEAYKPKSKAKAAPTPAEKMDQITEAEEGDGALSPSASLNTDSSAGKPQLQSSTSMRPPERIEDNLVLFCPTGLNTKELARVRLQPCCGFSDSLPRSKDEGGAKLTIIALLFWNVNKDSTDDTIREWYSRMAEINHVPAPLRPYTVVLAYEADDSQETSLSQFTDKMKGVGDAVLIDDGSEDGITGSLQDLAELAINRLKKNERNSGVSEDIKMPATQKTKFCTIA